MLSLAERPVTLMREGGREALPAQPGSAGGSVDDRGRMTEF
jgi:hypothetical protein